MNIPIKRGGKEYTLTIGVVEGKSMLYIVDSSPDENFNQPVRKAPISLTITFDEGELNGEVTSIKTVWKECLISNSGKPIHASGTYQHMITKPADITAFCNQLGMYNLLPMSNGYVRDIMGFNDKPVFNSLGQVIGYTDEQMNEPPTNDYHG